MRVIRNLSPACSAGFSVVLALLLLTAVEAAQDTALSKIKIKNFGCVNQNYYRGAQPQGQDYRDLAGLGVRMVIDLEREGDANEQQEVEAAGMKFHRMEMSDKSRPTFEQAEEFLKMANDPANQPVFVHCHGGRHRTGAMTAIYRIANQGWTADIAYDEMKRYDFGHGIGHGPLKEFVYDYYKRTNNKGAVIDSAK